MLPRVQTFEDVTRESPAAGMVVHFPSATPVDTDIHAQFEVGVVLRGQQERRFGGLVRVANPGDAWFSPGWEPHGWRVTAPDTDELVIWFAPELLGEESFEGVSWLRMFATPPSRRPEVKTCEVRQSVLAIGQDLATELAEKRWGWLAAVRAGVVRLLVTMGREWDPPAESLHSPFARVGNLERIAPALQLVYRETGRRVTIAEAAQMCTLSMSQFRLVFRRTMGLSFGRFAVRARLARAADLLLNTGLAVAEVAAETGFVDGSHFHHVFPKEYGCTPTRYREEGRRVAAGRT